MPTEMSFDDFINALEIGGVGETVANATDASQNVTSGRAVIRITDVFPQASKNTQTLQLIAQCTVLEHSDPKQAGKTYRQRWGFSTPQNVSYFNLALVNLGLAPVAPDTWKADLKRVAQELQGICCEVTFGEKKTNDGYPPPMYINAGARRQEREGNSVKAAPAF